MGKGGLAAFLRLSFACHSTYRMQFSYLICSIHGHLYTCDRSMALILLFCTALFSHFSVSGCLRWLGRWVYIDLLVTLTRLLLQEKGVWSLAGFDHYMASIFGLGVFCWRVGIVLGRSCFTRIYL